VANEGETPGWDVEYKSERKLVCIEVKATSGPALPAIELTAGEWAAAQIHRDRYVLALVANVRSDRPSVEFFRDPFKLVNNGTFSVEPLAWRLRRDQT
jgi:hypothetical protein